MGAFEGDDAWVATQLQEAQARKRRQEQDAQKLIVTFDRNAFTKRVQSLLENDVSDGFVIGLKHRQEFARQLCHEYPLFTEQQKLDLILALAIDLGLQDLNVMVKTLPPVDRSRLVLSVLAATLGFHPRHDPSLSKNIKRGLVPVAERFFHLVSPVPEGPEFLMTLRKDIQSILRKHRTKFENKTVRALEFMDMVMKMLFATQAGMKVRRIELSSPELSSFVLLHERVHPIRTWTDLKQRVEGTNRYAYGLFHSHMPTKPLVFIELMLSDHLCNNLDEVMRPDDIPLSNPSHILFYSISNSNTGLRGLNVASHLLFQTIELMSKRFPSCSFSATLSPVPGFAKWLQQALLSIESSYAFTKAQAQPLLDSYGVSHQLLGKWLLKRLKEANWQRDLDFASALRTVLTVACARYVLFARSENGKIQDPVAHFHLQNGAQVEQVNFLANTSEGAMENSYGMMVNYRYCLPSIHATSVSYKRQSSAAVAPSIVRMLWHGSSVVLDEIERLASTRNIPLYARTCERGTVLCTRGEKPSAMYFISAGSVKVSMSSSTMLEAGASIYDREIIGGEPVPYTLTTQSTTHLFALPAADLLTLLSSSPRLQKMISLRPQAASRQGHLLPSFLESKL